MPPQDTSRMSSVESRLASLETDWDAHKPEKATWANKLSLIVAVTAAVVGGLWAATQTLNSKAGIVEVRLTDRELEDRIGALERAQVETAASVRAIQAVQSEIKSDLKELKMLLYTNKERR